MCNTCGCSGSSGATEIKCVVSGYTPITASQVENSLLGLPGVLHVHIHAHDGATTIQYQPVKTSLLAIEHVFAQHDLTMSL